MANVPLKWGIVGTAGKVAINVPDTTTFNSSSPALKVGGRISIDGSISVVGGLDVQQDSNFYGDVTSTGQGKFASLLIPGTAIVEGGLTTTLQTNDISIDNGDKLVVTDASNSNKVSRTTLAFGTGSTFLKNNGTWATPTNTKNTAGSTDTSSKIFLIGATSQDANPQTYSDDQVYTQSGDLTSNRFISLNKSVNYINQNQVCGLLAKKTASTDAWYPAVCLDTYGGGHWQIGNYNDERLVFCYGTKTNKNAGTNKTQRFYLPAANNNNDLSATIAVYLEKVYSVTIGSNTYDGFYYADINVSDTATNYHVMDLSVVSVTGNHWATVTYYTANNIRVWTKATGITVEVKVMGIAI